MSKSEFNHRLSDMWSDIEDAKEQGYADYPQVKPALDKLPIHRFLASFRPDKGRAQYVEYEELEAFLLKEFGIDAGSNTDKRFRMSDGPAWYKGPHVPILEVRMDERSDECDECEVEHFLNDWLPCLTSAAVQEAEAHLAQADPKC